MKVKCDMLCKCLRIKYTDALIIGLAAEPTCKGAGREPHVFLQYRVIVVNLPRAPAVRWLAPELFVIC